MNEWINNKIGPKTEPWGIPLLTVAQFEKVCWMRRLRTLFLLVKKAFSDLHVHVCSLNFAFQWYAAASLYAHR